MRRTLKADVCVIGTGAGGAPVAKEMAESGARVVVLEEGDRVAPEALTGRPRDMVSLLYRDAGQFATLGTPPILLPLGKAVGGTTLVNSGTCFRAPAHVRMRWATELGLDDVHLDPHYEHVEKELGVAPVAPELAGPNAHVARRGAEALGWSGGWLSRNATGCRGSGVCAFGCPTQAKRHAGISWMAKAVEAGADLRARTRAVRIDPAARSVEARDEEGPLTVHADTIVVAAGTVHTPGLLATAGVGTPHLGRHLTIHPATSAWALMDEEVDMARGVPQSYHVDEFASQGIMLEGIAGPPDYLAMALPFTGDRHRELMLGHRRLAQFGLMIEDTVTGRVLAGRMARRLGRPVVRYDLDQAGADRVKEGLARLTELFRAAGARTVLTPLADAREVPGADPSTVRRLDVRPRDLKLMAFHPLGTARAARRPADGVVDGHGRVHGLGRVFVADGSAVPTALGVNPQLTIMALAVRLAHHLKGAR